MLNLCGRASSGPSWRGASCINNKYLLSDGSGHDRIFGGAGYDLLLGHAGDDHLDGGLGDDRLFS